MSGDRIVALIFIVVATLFFYSSYFYPPAIMAFPRFVFTVLILLSLILLITAPDKRRIRLSELFPFEKFLTLILVVLYVICIPLVGYFPSSFVFTIAYMYIFERKNLLKHVLISGGLMFFFYLTFEKFLGVWLP